LQAYAGTKSWAFRYRFNGKPKKLTLGPLYLGEDERDAVGIDQPNTLAGARKLAGEAALQVAKGIDPSKHKKREKHQARLRAENSAKRLAIAFCRVTNCAWYWWGAEAIVWPDGQLLALTAAPQRGCGDRSQGNRPTTTIMGDSKRAREEHPLPPTQSTDPERPCGHQGSAGEFVARLQV